MGLAVEKLNITAAMSGGTALPIVQELCFSVEKGQKLAIVGSSGCGKTMTAMSILGLLPENCHAGGSIFWDGTELLSLPKRERRLFRGRELVLIPQSGADFLNPVLKIKKQLFESLRRAGLSKSELNSSAIKLLSRVGFDDPRRILSSYPFQLSGGMAQRVVMAMALAGNPGLVIADEPTRGVDSESTQKLLALLDELFQDAALILITHDISVAARCDLIMVMDGGKCVELGSSEQVLNRPKSIRAHQLICDLPHALSHVEKGGI